MALGTHLEVEDGAALRVVERGRAVEEAEEEGDRGDAGDDLEAEAPRIEAEMGERVIFRELNCLERNLSPLIFFLLS